MVNFNIFSSKEVGDSSSPNDLVIRTTNSDEPSALGSVGSSYLEVIPEGDEEAKNTKKKKRNKRYKLMNPPQSEVGSLISRTTADELEVRDYDENPTILYSLLQGRAWEDAITRIDKHPEEAKIWTFRRDVDGNGVRWKLLPLHAAIIFKGPVEVVESLITVFPEAAQIVDDQQSLPIHLAYKRGASASTYRLLLDCFHGCLNVKDAKGRTPRDLARNGSGPRHVEFNYALKVHMASRKHAREEARVEEEKKFTEKLEEAKNSHKKNLEELKEKNRQEIAQMEAKIKSLEQDVVASQSVAKTLNENIDSLQKQLKRHQRTEKYLKEKLTGKSIDIDEELWKTPLKSMDMEDDLEDLTDQINHLKEEIEKLLLEKEILNKSLESVVETTEWEKRKLERKIEEQRRTIESLRAGARKAEEEKTKLQDELEKKEEKEKGLVNTIGELENQLKSHHAEVEEAVGETKRQKEKLEQHCETLRKSNTKMTDQLKSVSNFLGEMRDEHDGIVEKAALHEKEIELVAVEHEKILKYVEEQQQRDFEAQRQRYIIAKLLKAQEDEMARNVNARQRIKDAIANQSKRSSRIATQRKELMESSKKIGVKVEEKLKGVLCAIPQNTPEFADDDSSGQSLLYSPSSTDASLNERRNDFEHRQYSGGDSSRIGIDPPDELPVRTRKPIRLSLWNESSPYIEIR